VGLSWLGLDGGGGSLRIGGEEDRDRPGGGVPVNCWQIVPIT